MNECLFAFVIGCAIAALLVGFVLTIIAVIVFAWVAYVGLIAILDLFDRAFRKHKQTIELTKQARSGQFKPTFIKKDNE